MYIGLPQSRIAASFFISLLLRDCLPALQPRFATALELDPITSSIFDSSTLAGLEVINEKDGSVQDEEAGQTELHVEGRDLSGVLFLLNNSPANKVISIGETQYWAVSTTVINGPAGETGTGLPTDSTDDVKQRGTKHELRRRQSPGTLYVSLNTCQQPAANTTAQNTTVIPPQLLMYLSTTETNQKPGPASRGDQLSIEANGGYALINITSTTNVYIGIAAPNTTQFTGTWTYEIAASIDAPYHQLEQSTPYLHFVDGDTHAALLTTADLTTAQSNSSVYQEWMTINPPYGMFAQNQLKQAILGVSNSYCGLRSNALIQANLNSGPNQHTVAMTNRGLGGHPKEQFYITDLDPSSNYWGFLAMAGNSTMSGQNVVGGGGKVWAPMTFTTKAEPNCALMYNLTFCSEVAYAVPTNPDLFSPRTGLPALAAIYDSYAAHMYQFFNYSLQQIPCNTTASAQYSLARNCDDCAEAYKRWLCTVTIPRCEDYTNTATYLKPRNVAQPFANGTTINPNQVANQMLLNAVASNQSRNSIIDTQIRPGPYKEVLPCYDVCYNLVQSCPAALGFGCPHPGGGMEDSYGQRSSNASEITCSWLGAAYDLSAANILAKTPSMKLMIGLTVLVAVGLCL